MQEIRPQSIFIDKLTATLKCWQWGAMHCQKFDEFYLGFNLSPIEFRLNRHRYFSIFHVVFNYDVWLTTYIPYAAINQYYQATKSDVSLIWQ